MTGHSLLRRTAVLATALLLPMGVAIAAPAGPGSPGIGDPYYDDYGNGGYDVRHYTIDVSYTRATDSLSGVTRIRARATQKLSRFNLDFVLPVSRVRVNNRPATYTQSAHELVVTPHHNLRRGDRMLVTVAYAGVPSTEFADGINPWIRTPDGVAAVGE